MRTLVAIGADVGLPHDRFRRFQPDDVHRVCSPTTGSASSSGSTTWACASRRLVNLSFLGGDRARRGGGDDFSATARAPAPFPTASAASPPGRRCSFPSTSRAAPSGTRRGPAPRRCRAAAPMPDAVKTLAVAYGVAAAAASVGSACPGRPVARAAQRAARRRWRSPARQPRCAAVRRPSPAHNGAVGVELMRDGRGAAYVVGDGARRRRHRPLPPAARSPAGARSLLLRLRGRRSAMVDRLGASAARRRLSGPQGRLQPLPHRQLERRRARRRWRSAPIPKARC